MLKHKKVSRNYRVSALFDLIVKRGSKLLGSSESDFLELCVLSKAEEAIALRKGLETLAKDDKELTGWVLESSRQLYDRITKIKRK
jgi:hypothetical protein